MKPLLPLACCFLAALALASAVQAQPPIPAAMVYETAASASAGTARLLLSPIDATTYAIDLAIVAPNQSRHTGHVQGLATRDGKRYTLKAANFMENGMLDNPPLCTLVLDIGAQEAKVVSADACAFFHGAGADFMEQGQHMLRRGA